MLLWEMATTLPTVMVKAAMAAMMIFQSSRAGMKAVAKRRSIRTKLAALEATAR